MRPLRTCGDGQGGIFLPLVCSLNLAKMHFLEDEDERDRRRAQRREYHLVVQLCEKIAFESVKEKEIRDKGLSFGSRADRITLPIKSCFWDPKFCVKPNTTATKSQQVVSTVPRFGEIISEVPAPNVYNLPKEKIKAWSFKMDLSRPDNFEGKNCTPG